MVLARCIKEKGTSNIIEGKEYIIDDKRIYEDRMGDKYAYTYTTNGKLIGKFIINYRFQILNDIPQFKSFIDLFDNWNTSMRINDNDLNVIEEGIIGTIMDKRRDLYNHFVIAFGIIDGILTIRLVKMEEVK